MKNCFQKVSHFRLPYLLLVTASAGLLTIDILDSDGEPLSFGLAICLIVGAWLMVIFAWKAQRRFLPYWTLKHTIGVVLLELFVVNVVQGWLPPSRVRQYSALEKAICSNNLSAVQKILRAGASPSFTPRDNYGSNQNRVRDLTPIETAVTVNKLDIVEELLRAGASANVEGASILTQPATRGDVMMLSTLVASGAAVNEKDGNSWALWEAVQYGKLDAVVFLLHHGANPNGEGNDPTDQSSWSVLKLARSTDNLPVVKALIHAGAREFVNAPKYVRE